MTAYEYEICCRFIHERYENIWVIMSMDGNDTTYVSVYTRPDNGSPFSEDNGVASYYEENAQITSELLDDYIEEITGIRPHDLLDDPEFLFWLL